jgi:hypothetical protein
MQTYRNEDGTESFLVDAMDAEEAKAVLAKFDVEFVDSENALFDGQGRVTDVDFTVKGKNDDISFALESMVKMTRPYPKAFVHKSRARVV